MHLLLHCLTSIAILLFSALVAVTSAQAGPSQRGGDLGIPANYEQTMRRFSETMPDFARAAAALPAAFDWRTTGKVTPARNQSNCGGCWAFASTGALEAKLLILGAGSYDLAEQQQISCNTAMSGCNGGGMESLRYWEGSTGPLFESCAPFSSGNGQNVACETISTCSQLPFRTSGYYTVDVANRDEIKTSLQTDGPTYFRYDWYTDFDTFWKGQVSGTVYTNTSGAFDAGHAVLLIGWDDAKGAWLLKNSYGATGGPNGDGTFWMAYTGHRNDLKFGMANIKASAPTPTVVQPDILWRNSNGRTGVWKMFQTSILTWASSRTVTGAWQIQATGDFNNDGKTDVLWRHPESSKVYIVYMDGADWHSTVFAARLDDVPAPWTIGGTGDFDGDGYLDIVWRHPGDGRVIIWFMQNATKKSTANITAAGAEFTLVGVGDFNFDAKPDLIFRNAAQSKTTIWFMDGLAKTATVDLQTVAPEWKVVGVGDFDADRSPDIFWRNTQNGRNSIMLLTGTTTKSIVLLQKADPSLGWDAVGVGVFH